MSLESPLTSIEIANARLWKNEIYGFQNQLLPFNGVLFTGSSSIAYWSTLDADFPDIEPINRGFGGSQLSDSVYHFDALVLPVAPRAIVLYAGDNDLALGKTSARVTDNFRAFAELMRLRLPETALFFISIKPSPARWNLISEIRSANSQIKNACRDDSQLHFVDMESSMIDDEGLPRADLYVEDELHLSPRGYAIWSGVLRPLLAPYATYLPDFS